jgi:hypothetical protein
LPSDLGEPSFIVGGLGVVEKPKSTRFEWTYEQLGPNEHTRLLWQARLRGAHDPSGDDWPFHLLGPGVMTAA